MASKPIIIIFKNNQQAKAVSSLIQMILLISWDTNSFIARQFLITFVQMGNSLIINEHYASEHWLVQS